jgi:Asp-tRNA(Asn)/Glu-tRNA(Gln) amidotransferase A subunit family amidase
MLVTTRKLFFQTGFTEGKAALAAGGEEMMPGVKFALETFKTRPLSITEVFACNTQMSMWKGQMAEWWSSTVTKTSTGRPIDDPEMFAAQPVCLQIVGRPFQDEEVVAVMEALDPILNP